MNITGTPREQCPLDIPYAFKDGTKCCHDDKDRQGNPLTFTSMTCYRGLEIECSKERCISNGMIVEHLLKNDLIKNTDNHYDNYVLQHILLSILYS